MDVGGDRCTEMCVPVRGGGLRPTGHILDVQTPLIDFTFSVGQNMFKRVYVCFLVFDL